MTYNSKVHIRFATWRFKMTLRNSSGKKIGEVKERGFKKVAYDANGRKVGEYDGNQDITRDAHGRKIGCGDLLTTLL
jgi:hypothetical protein